MTVPIFNVPQSAIEEAVNIAIHEDVGDGDITALLIPEDKITIASVISRENCVLCGMDWFEEVFRQIDDEILIEWHAEDGDNLETDQAICSLSGSARSILTGERSALNFLQTLSATATLSAAFAKAVEGTGAIVLDTRKTIPGLRLAQKYAVSCGGCQNHRIGLYDAILIKENHILACGSIENAIEESRFHNPEMPVEVEVENIDEFNQALDANADRVLLDNFTNEQLVEAVKICAGKTPLEASGNVTLNNIHDIALTGVDFISTGALTKDIQAIDLSMRFT
ncbi:MAG: carboxylating nicotinate-nucleotide diphosphorylase [Gammaproteobacteria bacterium]|nr:carboxylating nicotinate-nucleotide diphosphorylase [Gammaproteobacteria bacterium]